MIVVFTQRTGYEIRVSLVGSERCIGDRAPIDFPIIAALACLLMQKGLKEMGIWLLVAHGAYLRPSEAMQIRAKDLVQPTDRFSRQWCPRLFYTSDPADEAGA